MRPSCFPFLSHENTIEGNMLLQQPQLLKTRVNMSFEALPLLCKLTASGSPLILILYGKFNSRSYAAFLYSQIKKNNRMEHATPRNSLLTSQQAVLVLKG